MQFSLCCDPLVSYSHISFPPFTLMSSFLFFFRLQREIMFHKYIYKILQNYVIIVMVLISDFTYLTRVISHGPLRLV